jgi:hypothetical protein
VEDAYVYPQDVLKGESHEEVLAACQLPDDVLERISTAGLIRSLLDFPLLASGYFASSNSSPIGTFNSIFALHNSVPELEQRRDAAGVLLQYYQSVGFGCFETFRTSSPEENIAKKWDATAQIIALHVLFTREKILSRYDSHTKRQLVALLLQNLRQLEALDMRLGILEVMAWIMYDDRYAPAVAHFGPSLNKDWLTLTSEGIPFLLSFAESYANGKI